MWLFFMVVNDVVGVLWVELMWSWLLLLVFVSLDLVMCDIVLLLVIYRYMWFIVSLFMWFFLGSLRIFCFLLDVWLMMVSWLFLMCLLL